MRYRVMGKSSETEGTPVNVERVEGHYTLTETEDGEVIFDVFLDTENQKDILYEQAKSFIDENGHEVNWHECTHDEENPQPCVIAEKYEG